MSEYALSVTLKAGKDFDSPWIVVYGNAPDEVQSKLEAIANGGIIEATVNAANALKAANNAAPLLQNGGAVTPPTLHDTVQAQPAHPPAQQQHSPWGAQQHQQAVPQQPQQQFGGPQNGTPHPEGKTCPSCGSVVKYKAFTSKAGKDFKMWTCPNQRSKGDGHHSEFI